MLRMNIRCLQGKKNIVVVQEHTKPPLATQCFGSFAGSHWYNFLRSAVANVSSMVHLAVIYGANLLGTGKYVCCKPFTLYI